MSRPTPNVCPTHVRDLVPFQFQDIQLKEACWMNGKPWFTRRAIGEFLGYAGAHARRAVAKIIERNPHIQQFATHVNLTTVEGGRPVTREIEVFDPIGLQLIIFESRQPKATGLQGGRRPSGLGLYAGPAPSAGRDWVWPATPSPRFGAAGTEVLAVDVLADEKQCGRSTIYRHRTMLRAGVDPSRKRYPTLMDRWERQFPHEKRLVVAALLRGWSAMHVWREVLSASLKPSLHMVRALGHRLRHAESQEGALNAY